jgi:hypothetical protein
MFIATPKIKTKDVFNFTYNSWAKVVYLEVRSLLRDFTIDVYFLELAQKHGLEASIFTSDPARNFVRVNPKRDKEFNVIDITFEYSNKTITWDELKSLREDNISQHFMTKFAFNKEEDVPILKYVENKECYKLVTPNQDDLQEIYIQRVNRFREELV